MTSTRFGYWLASRWIRAWMSSGVMYASMKSFWYFFGVDGGVAPGQSVGGALVVPPRLDVAVSCTGCAGTGCGLAKWYWYSLSSTKRSNWYEPVSPLCVRHVIVIWTSGSSVAVVVTCVPRNACPPLVHQYACRKCNVSVLTACVTVAPDAVLVVRRCVL